MSIANYNYLFKFILVGDTCKNKSYNSFFFTLDVGKSNMLMQYTQNQFRGEHQITIGCEFMAKNLQINSKSIRIQVWDTAGQEAFRSITRSYYKNSACAIIVYDITNRESYTNISEWLKDCREMSPKSSIAILVGNKCDLESKRQVTTEEAAEFASNNSLFFMETSAMTGFNIDNLFVYVAKEVMDRIENGSLELKDDCGIKIGSLNEGKELRKERNNSLSVKKKHLKCCK